MQPLTFTSSVRLMISSGTSWNTPGMFTPALLNATSSRPQRSTVPSVYALTAAASETSAPTANAASPSSRATASTASRLMSTQVTRAPSSANRMALARPMPEPAPVTMVTLPASRSPIAVAPPPSQSRPTLRHGIDTGPHDRAYCANQRADRVEGEIVARSDRRRRRVSEDGRTAHGNSLPGHGTSAPAGVRPRAPARDEDVLQLRGLVHDHLDPVGMSHPVLLRDEHG